MPSLLAFLHEDHPTFTQTSAGDFIKAIITISANASQNEQSCIGPNSLTRQLVSEPCIDSLITNMLKGGNPLTVGVGIIIEVIRKNNSDYDPEVQTGQDYPPSTSDPIYLGTLLRQFAKHVPDFMELILSPNHTVLQGDASVSVKRKSLLVASGKSIEPLGFDRFKTCELMAELLHCSNMGLLNEKGSETYIQQRDKERERLRAEGALARAREPQSAVTEFSEDESSFDTDAPDSSSPSSSRRLEVTNSADDDGFEDVGRSEDIPNEGKEGLGLSTDDSSGPRTVKKASSRLSLDDEFFDEPLESPKKTEEAAQVGSPTSAVASQVRALDIKDENKSSESSDSTDDLVSEIESQLQPKSKEDDSLLKPGDAHDGALSTSPLSMSPNPNDTPAPLFTPRSEEPQTEAGGSESEPQGDAEGEQAQEGEISMPFVPYLESDIDGRPIVGDFLKRQFVDHRVVPTILVSMDACWLEAANNVGFLLPLPLEQLSPQCRLRRGPADIQRSDGSRLQPQPRLRPFPDRSHHRAHHRGSAAQRRGAGTHSHPSRVYGSSYSLGGRGGQVQREVSARSALRCSD
jgi:SIT4-associating protein SAP185/190